MKRYIAIMLSVLLIIGLTACTQAEAPPAPPLPVASDDPPPEASPADTSFPSTVPGPSQPALSQPPEISGAATAEGAAGAGGGQSGQQAAEDPAGTVPVERIVIELESNVVVKGTILDPNVVILPSGAADKSFTINSSDEDVVRQRYGYWTAVGGGSADLTATASNGITGAVTVTVVVYVESVSLGVREITLDRGDTSALSPTIVPSDATDTSAAYTSSDEAVVSVSGDGVISAVGAGTAVVQCTIGGKSASCTVTVGVPVSGVSVDVSRRVLEIGDQGSYTVQISPQDATDKTFSVEVSGSAVTLTGEGTFSCTAGGEATITATSANGISARQVITVIDLVAYADEVFRLTNAERLKAGLPALSGMPALTLTAVVRAKETIRSFSHDRPDGSDCFTAFDENYVQYTMAGENIAMGQRTPSEVVSGWMNSPGHRENILNEDFGHLGVGVALDSGGRLYWSQNFTD